MTDLQLTPPGPIESAALCSAFANANESIQCEYDKGSQGPGHFTVQGMTFPVTLFAAHEMNAVMAALQGKGPMSSTAGFDTSTDPEMKGGFFSHAQLEASRAMERNFVLDDPNHAAPALGYLALRGFAVLAGGVVQRAADLFLGGDWWAAYQALQARGWTPPEGWLSQIGMPSDYIVKSDTNATIANTGAAFKAAFHGLVATEAADPAFVAQTLVTDQLETQPWEGAAAKKVPAFDIGSETRSETTPAGTFTFVVLHPKSSEPLVQKGIAYLGHALGASFVSLADAYTKLEAELGPKVVVQNPPPPPVLGPPPQDPGVPGQPGTQPGTPGQPSTPTPKPTTQEPEKKRFPWGWFAAGVGAVALIGGGIYLLSQQKGEAPEGEPAPEPEPEPEAGDVTDEAASDAAAAG